MPILKPIFSPDKIHIKSHFVSGYMYFLHDGLIKRLNILANSAEMSSATYLPLARKSLPFTKFSIHYLLC